MQQPYRTLESEIRHEAAKIKGSRFIATAAPFRGEAELAARIVELRREFPEANHHCHAWRDGNRFRHSDDGEPGGTAGRWILSQIDGRGLDKVVVIVTRVFGGTKLGAGGLVRAYSTAAGAVLDAAEIVEVVPVARVRVTVPYDCTGALRSVTQARGLTAVESEFAERVRQSFDVAVGEVESFVGEVMERTAGRAEIETDGDQDTR